MLTCPHVALPESVPGCTSAPVMPAPVAVFPLKLPRKSASRLIATLPLLVVKLLFVIVAVEADSVKIPVGFRLKLFPLIVGLEEMMRTPIEPLSDDQRE